MGINEAERLGKRLLPVVLRMTDLKLAKDI
jgi:hypothetical protein